MKSPKTMMSFEESLVFLMEIIKKIQPLFTSEFKINAYEHPFYPTDNPWDFIEIWNMKNTFGVRIHWPRKWHEHCLENDCYPEILEKFYQEFQGKWRVFRQEMDQGIRFSDDWTFLYPDAQLYSYDELKRIFDTDTH